MIVAGAAGGAAWARSRASCGRSHTNEIITSLMLNYVAALVLNYLIFDSHSYWRDTSATGAGLPAGQAAAGRGRRGRRSTLGSVSRCRSGSSSRSRVAIGRLGALLAHALRLRGAGDRRLAARRALRGHADAAEDPRRDLPLRRDRRHRRREPGRRLPPRARRARSPAGGLRLRRDRRRGARPLQPVRRRARRVPARRARRTPATRSRAPTSRPASSA